MQRRKCLTLAALAVLLHSCAAYAQAKIEIPATVQLGQPIVAAYQLGEGGRIAWRASPGTSVVNVGLGKAHLWAPPGKHYVEAVVVSVAGGELSQLEWLRQEYTVEGMGPAPPPPTPEPQPPPEPQPNGKRQVFVVYESGELTPHLALLLNDLAFGPTYKTLAAKGHPTPMARDDDHLPDRIKANLGSLPPLPALFVLDAATNRVLLAQPLPSDGAGVLALVQQTGG